MAGFCLGKFSVTLGDWRNLNQKTGLWTKKWNLRNLLNLQRQQKFSVIVNLYRRDEKPTKRVPVWFVDPKIREQYVRPLFPNRGENCWTPYVQNGYCYQLQPGHYICSVNFAVPEKRKYMIRALGEDLKLELLKWFSQVYCIQILKHGPMHVLNVQ